MDINKDLTSSDDIDGLFDDDIEESNQFMPIDEKLKNIDSIQIDHNKKKSKFDLKYDTQCASKRKFNDDINLKNSHEDEHNNQKKRSLNDSHCPTVFSDSKNIYVFDIRGVIIYVRIIGNTIFASTITIENYMNKKKFKYFTSKNEIPIGDIMEYLTDKSKQDTSNVADFVKIIDILKEIKEKLSMHNIYLEKK